MIIFNESTTEIDDAFHTLMWSKHVIKTKHVVRLRCLYPHEPRMIWPNLTLPNTRRTKRHLFEVGKLRAKSFWSFCTSRDQHYNKSSSHDISCLFFSNSLDLRTLLLQQICSSASKGPRNAINVATLKLSLVRKATIIYIYIYGDPRSNFHCHLVTARDLPAWAP